MPEALGKDLILAASFTFLGAVLGVIALMVSVSVISRILDRLTPKIDEQQELLRGNEAVAAYYGRVMAASILGLSLIIAASIMAGLK